MIGSNGAAARGTRRRGNDRRRLSVVDDSRDFMIRDIPREDRSRRMRWRRRQRRRGIGNEPIVTRRFRTVAYSRELLQHPLSHWRIAFPQSAMRDRERERERENCHFIVTTYRASSPLNRANDLVGLESCMRGRMKTVKKRKKGNEGETMSENRVIREK